MPVSSLGCATAFRQVRWRWHSTRCCIRYWTSRSRWAGFDREPCSLQLARGHNRRRLLGGASNNRINTDAALRASADGRSGLAWFLSQIGFSSTVAPRGLCGPLGAGGETDLAHSQLGKLQTGLHPWWKVVTGLQSWLCHDRSPGALEMASQKVLHPLVNESFRAGRGCLRALGVEIGAWLQSV